MRLLAAALALALGCRRLPPPIASLPEFTLSAVEARGERPFGRAEMLGRPWIVGFVYTRCAGPCPLLNERMRGLAGRLPAAIGLATISVDPDGDTPARLRALAARLGADGRRWVVLRGDAHAVYHAAFDAFRAPMSVDPAAPAERRVAHDTRLFLVDARGRLRGAYDGLGDAGADALARDARRILEDS